MVQICYDHIKWASSITFRALAECAEDLRIEEHFEIRVDRSLAHCPPISEWVDRIMMPVNSLNIAICFFQFKHCFFTSISLQISMKDF